MRNQAILAGALAQEAADNDLDDVHSARGISEVKAAKTAGTADRYVVTADKAQQQMGAPNVRTLKAAARLPRSHSPTSISGIAAGSSLARSTGGGCNRPRSSAPRWQVGRRHLSLLTEYASKPSQLRRVHEHR